MSDHNRSDDRDQRFDEHHPAQGPGKAAETGTEQQTAQSAETRETEPGGPAYFQYGPFASGAGRGMAGGAPNRAASAHSGQAGAYRTEDGEPGATDGASGHGASPEHGTQAPYEAASHDAVSGRGQSLEVELAPLPPLRPVPQDVLASGGGSKRAAKRKRSSFPSMFAAFMAGAVLVGGLMFASDKYNLFTADAATGGVQSSPPTVQTGMNGGNQGGLQNASLEVVRPNTIAEIVSNSQAAVVKIETYSKGTRRSTNPFYNDPFFRFFFGDDYNQPRQSPEGRLYKTGEGSGFLFDSDGYILTNQHVVDNADEIRVFVQGYENYFVAEKLGDSFDLDLAALKIEGKEPFAYLRLGDAEAMNVGDWVIAIGNPYGFDHTVTVGVLSAKERPITIREGQSTRQYENLLQTDASINPGNSGGPLLNLNGEVIGINTAVSAQAQGIGFAIPTSTITDVLDNLKNDTPIPKQPEPYIGVYLGNLDEAWKEELGFKGDGALVTQIEVGGPANRAGIRAGDIITEVAGQKIGSAEDVSKAVKEQEVGSNIHLKIFREGKTYEAVVTVGDRNASE